MLPPIVGSIFSVLNAEFTVWMCGESSEGFSLTCTLPPTNQHKDDEADEDDEDNDKTSSGGFVFLLSLGSVCDLPGPPSVTSAGFYLVPVERWRSDFNFEGAARDSDE